MPLRFFILFHSNSKWSALTIQNVIVFCRWIPFISPEPFGYLDLRSFSARCRPLVSVLEVRRMMPVLVNIQSYNQSLPVHIAISQYLPSCLLTHWRIYSPRKYLFRRVSQSRFEAEFTSFLCLCKRIWSDSLYHPVSKCAASQWCDKKFISGRSIVRNNPSVDNIQLYFPSIVCERTTFDQSTLRRTPSTDRDVVLPLVQSNPFSNFALEKLLSPLLDLTDFLRLSSGCFLIYIQNQL